MLGNRAADTMTEEEHRQRLVALQEARARLDAQEARSIAALDAVDGWSVDGATTGAAWLRCATGMSGDASRLKLRVARRLVHMPLTAAAFDAGRLTFDRVRILATARTGRTVEAFDRDEEMLVRSALEFDTDSLEHVVRYWKAVNDPDGVSKAAAEAWNHRHANLRKTYGGVGHLAGLLDPESTEVVLRIWDRIDEELRVADRRDRELNDVTPRTPSQRRADAFVEMCRRADEQEHSERPGTRSRPSLFALIDHDTLVEQQGGHATLLDGTVLSGDAARRMACDAAFVRAVTTGRSEVLDLGRSTPNPNAAQRRAVLLRDGGCVWPGCEVRPERCDIHHIDPFRRGDAHGGDTDLDGLAMACGRHHWCLHEGRFWMERDQETGAVVVHRPDGSTLVHRQRAGPITPRAVINPSRYTKARGRRRRRARRQAVLARARLDAAPLPMSG